MMSSGIMLALLVFVFVLALIRRQRYAETFVNAVAATATASRPTLWWFADNLDAAYMKRALAAVQHTQSRDFIIVPLIGRHEIIQYIPRADDIQHALALPPDLWRSYVIANIAAAHGGFVMDGSSTLCVAGPSLYERVRNVDAAMFGVTHDETIVSPETAVAPGPSPYAGWARVPHHPSWVAAAAVWNDLVVRGPQAWTAASARRAYLAVWETQKTHGAVILRDVDNSRHANGQLRTIEDLFGRTDSIDTRNAAYISYDGDDLTRRFTYNWIQRLSDADLRDAEFTWAKLATATLKK
jgi:hypothetical protein